MHELSPDNYKLPYSLTPPSYTGLVDVPEQLEQTISISVQDLTRQRSTFFS